MAHAAYEIAVGGGNTLLSLCQNTHIASQAGTAGRGTDNSTGLDEGLDVSLLHSLQIDSLRCGNDDHAQTGSYLFAFHDLRCRLNITDSAVGAGPDHYLIDGNIVNLIYGMGILGKVRECNGRLQCRQIDDISLIEEKVGLDALPAQLREIAKLRLDNPESSLTELGEMLDPKVGKSGVNHRLRKIGEFAENLRQQ